VPENYSGKNHFIRSINMKTKKIFYHVWICLLILFAAGGIASGEDVMTFLLGGQSNMVGTGNIMDLPEELQGAQTRVIIYSAGTISSPWTTLQPGTGALETTFGPELTFGKNISDAFPPETIALIKVAWSGSSLAYDWRPPSAGETVGQYYTQFVNEVRNALATFPSGSNPVISGMCWMQGESDACDIHPASEYESNLTCLISDLRAEFNHPQMPFIIAMIDQTSTWKEYAVVREAEMNVANADTYVGIFDTDDFATDGSHYLPEGLISMGEAFASSMLDFLPGTTTPLPGHPGDVNADDSVDILDALLTAQYYVGLNPSYFNTGYADVDCSGSIDILDALLIAQYYVGLITHFPC
jgi:hypothetical protein